MRGMLGELHKSEPTKADKVGLEESDLLQPRIPLRWRGWGKVTVARSIVLRWSPNPRQGIPRWTPYHARDVNSGTSAGSVIVSIAFVAKCGPQISATSSRPTAIGPAARCSDPLLNLS